MSFVNDIQFMYFGIDIKNVSYMSRKINKNINVKDNHNFFREYLYILDQTERVVNDTKLRHTIETFNRYKFNRIKP